MSDRPVVQPSEENVQRALEHERDFWEERYRVQHKSLHSAEDLIAKLRAENRELRLRLGEGTERLP